MKKTRTDLLNLICEIRKPQRYLEIGIKDGVNFMAVNCPEKVGVDPAPFQLKAYNYAQENGHNLYQLKSDDYFKRYSQKFDLIFIDGDHTEEQTDRDIDNAFSVLSAGGIIVCHDALPHNFEYTRPEWCGTSYKAIMQWAQNSTLQCITWEGDHGCAIFKPKMKVMSQFDGLDCTFETLWENDAEIVNKSTWEEVEKWLRNLE